MFVKVVQKIPPPALKISRRKTSPRLGFMAAKKSSGDNHETQLGFANIRLSKMQADGSKLQKVFTVLLST